MWWNFARDVIDRNFDVIAVISKKLFKEGLVVIFAGIIKIFKHRKEVKRVKNYVPKSNLYLYFLI